MKAQPGPQTHGVEETHHATSEACTDHADRYFSKCGSAMTGRRVIRLSPNLKATKIVPACTLYGLLGFLLLTGVALHAQQTPESLEKLARNPVGDSIKIPLAESINFDAGPYARTSNSLQIQPTIPFPTAEEWLLVPRIVATLADYEPEVSQASGGNTGLRDTVATLFLTPAHTGMVVWGAGPPLLIPTATDTNTGAGKWGLGSSLAFILQPNWGSIATAVQNIWSFAGNSQRTPVNQLQVETARRLAEMEAEVCNVLQLHDIESEDKYACRRTTSRTA